MVDIHFHPEPQAEYDSAFIRYQARSKQTATRFESDVQRALSHMAAFPESYPSYHADHRLTVLRRFPFSLVFQVHPGIVYIVAVAHSHQSAGYWKGRT